MWSAEDSQIHESTQRLPNGKLKMTLTYLPLKVSVTAEGKARKALRTKLEKELKKKFLTEG